ASRIRSKIPENPLSKQQFLQLTDTATASSFSWERAEQLYLAYSAWNQARGDDKSRKALAELSQQLAFPAGENRFPYDSPKGFDERRTDIAKRLAEFRKNLGE